MNAHFDPAKAQAAALAPLVERSSYQRSSYQRSRGSDPVAIIASLGLGAALLAAFAFMNPHFVHKQKPETTIVTMMELPEDPPPAAEPPPEPDAPPPQPAIAAPAPLVPLPQTPVMAAPPPAPQPAAPAPKAPPAPMAPIAKGPENVGDLSAHVVFRRPIRVPLESRRAHEEGIVILSVLLSTDGSVADISIAQSSGFPRLDHAALDSVQDWRWSPLVRDGNPVMVRGLVRIPFIRERGGRDRHDGRRGGHGRSHHGDRDDDQRGDGPDDRV